MSSLVCRVPTVGVVFMMRTIRVPKIFEKFPRDRYIHRRIASSHFIEQDFHVVKYYLYQWRFLRYPGEVFQLHKLKNDKKIVDTVYQKQN